MVRAAPIHRVSRAASSPLQHSSAFLSSAVSPLNLALIILNVEPNQRHGAAAARFTDLWRQSSVRVCADGAANRLHDSLNEPVRSEMVPDLITGDLDSLRPDVASFYEKRGVRIEGENEQDSHDFEKCLRWLERQQTATPEQQQQNLHSGISDGSSSSSGGGGSGPADKIIRGGVSSAPFSVVAYGAFGGRLDHLMANLNMVYSFSCFERFLLLSDESLAFLLRPGCHVITTNSDVEDGTCGLIPLGARCERVVTSG